MNIGLVIIQSLIGVSIFYVYRIVDLRIQGIEAMMMRNLNEVSKLRFEIDKIKKQERNNNDN